MNPPKIALVSLGLLTALLLAPHPARGAASEWSSNPESRVRLISPWQVAPRGGELILGLHFLLAPGWHAYWKNSGDAGFPPAVTFQPAEVLGKPELLWPAPHRFDLPGGLVAFGYEDEVVYPVQATLWPDALPAPEVSADGRITGAAPFFIKADLDYLVCKIDCVPYRYTLTLEQPLGERPIADPETAPLLRSWLDRVPKTLGETPGLEISTLLKPGRAGEPELEISLLGVKAQPGKTDLFLEANEALEAGRPRMKDLGDGVIFHVPMKPREAGKGLPGKVDVAWTASNLTRAGESLHLEDRREVEVLTAAATPPKAPAAPDRFPRLLLWALLGGALLNLAPSVLALLVGETLELRHRGPRVREGAAAAATGIVGASWVLAGLALAARRAGLAVGWGTASQEPAVGALLAVLSALLALNLWGLLELPLPRRDSSRTGSDRHLLAGLFTVPLALAWPLPILQEPLGYAFGRGPAAVCAVFAVVGLGLALPYLGLALLPSAVRLVPGAESWWPRLREGLGFLAAAGTFWTLRALSRQVNPEGLAWIELALLGMALLAWLRARRGSGRALRLAFSLGALACVAGALWLADVNRLAPRAASRVPAFTLPTQTSGG